MASSSGLSLLGGQGGRTTWYCFHVGAPEVGKKWKVKKERWGQLTSKAVTGEPAVTSQEKCPGGSQCGFDVFTSALGTSQIRIFSHLARPLQGDVSLAIHVRLSFP